MFFPKLIFNNIKHIEKQLHYGKDAEYHWFNIVEDYKSDFEYYETLKITYYCNFHFFAYPFDHHNCNLTLGSKCLSTTFILLSEPTISFEETNTTDGMIKIKTENVPFDIKAKIIPPFNISYDGFSYAFVGISMNFQRNSLELLIGRFYGPTAIFAFLSTLSYNIAIEKVSIAKLILLCCVTFNYNVILL